MCQSTQQINQNSRKIRVMAWGSISIWILSGKKFLIPLKACFLSNRTAHSHSTPVQVVCRFQVCRAISSGRVKGEHFVCRIPGTTYLGSHLRIIDNLYLIQIKKIQLSITVMSSPWFIYLLEIIWGYQLSWWWLINYSFDVWLFFTDWKRTKSAKVI